MQFIQTNSNINIREYAGSICEIRGGMWRLTQTYRTFLEQLIIASKGRDVTVRVEFMKDKDIIASFTDL